MKKSLGFHFTIKAKLNCIEIARIPRNKTNIAILFLKEALLTNKSKYPTNILRQAQSTFTNGGESPLPGGVEKGVGNGTPEMP
jgi:hypothetical protein